MRNIATMRSVEPSRGAVRAEDVYDTDIDDLWRACSRPDRLARWIAKVAGNAAPGNTVNVTFTSSWSGPARIDDCDAPHHLLLTMDPGDDETQLEAWLTAEGSGTRLVVEERGLPLNGLHFYGAGWYAHLEDLARSLAEDGPVHPDGWSAESPAAGWHARWSEALPAYESAEPTGSEKT